MTGRLTAASAGLANMAAAPRASASRRVSEHFMEHDIAANAPFSHSRASEARSHVCLGFTRKTGLHGYQLLKAAPEHSLPIERSGLHVKIGHGRVLHDLRVHLVPVL